MEMAWNPDIGVSQEITGQITIKESNMNNYLKCLFLLLIVSFSFEVNGQINYKNGYVITNANDTLFGRINDGGGYRNARVCLFKETQKSKAIKYYPADIKAYRLINDKYYASKKIFIKGEIRDVFIDVLIEGKINLYHYWKTKNMVYYIEMKDSNMIGLVYKEITLSKKSPNQLIYNLDYNLKYMPYKDTLLSVFSKSEKILNKIENVEYDQKSLTNITKEYIKEVCKGNDCINYERDLNMYRPTVGVFSGVRLNKISFLASDTKPIMVTSFPIGVFLNFPMPLVNDKLSFQFELISNILNFKQELLDSQNVAYSKKFTSNTIGLPLLFKYEIARGRISPFVSIGKEIAFVYSSKISESTDDRLHPTQKGGWLGEVGLNYKLSPKLALVSTIRFQSNKNLIVGTAEHASYNSIKHKSTDPNELKTSYTTFSFGLQF